MNSYIINELVNIINDAIISADFKIEFEDIIVETNKNPEFGNYSTPIAMQLAKKYKKNPLQISEKIVNHINQKYPLIKSINFVAPGFINIMINFEMFSLVLLKIIKEKANYAKCENKNITYNIEFVSANPTGLLHLGHARNAAIGDSLANILQHRGYNVVREYYINDAGNQINVLAKSIFVRYQNLCGANLKMPEDSYQGQEITACATEFYQKYNKKYYQKPLDKVNESEFKNFGIKYMLSQIKSDLKKFNVKMNLWFHESSLYEKGYITNIVKQLQEKDHTYEKEGALWLRTTDYHDDKDRVIIKKDQTYTYMLPDLVYHDIKYKRSDFLINIWGADHYGYIPRIKAGLEALGHSSKNIAILSMQMVRVIQNGQEQKMSKRAGTSITLRSMLELIGKDALRYFMVSRTPETHLDIDIEVAKSSSSDNPVYYAQYAHARINQILQKAPKFEVATNIKLLNTSKEKDLLIVLDEYCMVLKRIEKKHEPHQLTNYINKLAKLFHAYYGEEKVISEDKLLTVQRLTLILAVKQILNNALNLIGIKAPDKM